jgi:peptide/nickel transport system permease protein
MLLYLLRRVVYAVPIALAVGFVCFMLVQIAPGDPINAIVPPDAPADVVEQVRKDYGLDKPLPVQFGLWISKVAIGDLGRSLATGRPVWADLRSAIGNTLMLAFAASAIGFTLGCVLGGLAGTFRGSALDRGAVGIAVAGVSVPHYWLGMVLVVIFSVQLNWLPAMGAGPGGSSDWGWDWDHVKHLILPAATLSVIPMGIVTRTVRGIVAEIMNQEFITALRGRVRACGEERRAERARRDGPAARLPDGRLDPGGDGVLLAGHRAAAQQRHLPARPAGAAGHDPGAGDVLRRAEPLRRSGADLARPPHQARLRSPA